MAEMVDVALDLLIDGERGVRHLAKAGRALDRYPPKIRPPVSAMG
jgi:hypothetical protein